MCTYSASSSSDTETELEYETNDFGTGGEKLVDLMKNNKQGNLKFVHRDVLIPPLSWQLFVFCLHYVYVFSSLSKSHFPLCAFYCICTSIFASYAMFDTKSQTITFLVVNPCVETKNVFSWIIASIIYLFVFIYIAFVGSLK